MDRAADIVVTKKMRAFRSIGNAIEPIGQEYHTKFVITT